MSAITTTTVTNDRAQRGQGEPQPVYERDDGRFQIGLDLDAPGPFPTRRFAEAVAGRAMIDD